MINEQFAQNNLTKIVFFVRFIYDSLRSLTKNERMSEFPALVNTDSYRSHNSNRRTLGAYNKYTGKSLIRSVSVPLGTILTILPKFVSSHPFTFTLFSFPLFSISFSYRFLVFLPVSSLKRQNYNCFLHFFFFFSIPLSMT